MTSIELFRRNKQYLQQNGLICEGDVADVQYVNVTEDEEGFEVVIDNVESIYVYKSEDFQFDDFFQRERLEVYELRCINVLNVLNVVTRETKYCGFDNYIYLIYDNQYTFAALACVVDLSVILDKNKFKVYIGESARWGGEKYR